MKPLLIAILGLVVRHALSGLSVWLVAQHLATADQADHLTSELLTHLTLVAPAAAAVGLSFWQKYRTHAKQFIGARLGGR